MIFINKPEPPSFLTDKNGKWHKETEKAIEHYKQDQIKPFKFECYRDPLLKDELKKIFQKCAYCESSYGAVFDGDVEHFRPKGKVQEKTPQTPGYYWLSNNWYNLLLSCQHCNQGRKHKLFGEDKLENYGKVDQFPLNTEDFRLTNHEEDLELEEPARLLINPCKDNPSEHFAYEITEGVIKPLTKMGEKSIEVFALQRPYLVQERKRILLSLLAQMETVKRELERLNSDNTAKQKTIFEREFDRLIEHTRPISPYAGMCRFFVRTFLKENNL